MEDTVYGHAPVIRNLPFLKVWIEHDWNGILVPAKDERKLAREIIGLLENSEKRSLFMERNRKLIQGKGRSVILDGENGGIILFTIK